MLVLSIAYTYMYVHVFYEYQKLNMVIHNYPRNNIIHAVSQQAVKDVVVHPFTMCGFLNL